VANRRQVELLEKNRPRQERAKRTYEAILSAAAELLIEVGVERISTNLISERAGITVPALYRYFPNKYSVLNAVGAALMDRQNEVFQEWVDSYIEHADPEVLLANVYEVLKSTYDVTHEQPGGVDILQALRAVGPLQELRLTSHRLVASQFAAILSELLQRPVDAQLLTHVRLTVEVAYGVVEMVLEDESLSVEDALRQGALMIQLYWREILQAA
jgi:AcrR family transcriptional regulator